MIIPFSFQPGKTKKLYSGMDYEEKRKIVEEVLAFLTANNPDGTPKTIICFNGGVLYTAARAAHHGTKTSPVVCTNRLDIRTENQTHFIWDLREGNISVTINDENNALEIMQKRSKNDILISIFAAF